MPTPASHPDEQRWPSPVPRYSVFPLLSVGSSVNVPTEVWSRSPGRSCFQSGSLARAFSVRQTPPPDAPTQTRQRAVPQSGDTTSAVTRLAVEFVAPEKAVTPGWTASSFGPKNFHLRPLAPWSPFCASSFAFRSNVARAFLTTAGGITSAGYVRVAAR